MKAKGPTLRNFLFSSKGAARSLALGHLPSSSLLMQMAAQTAAFAQTEASGKYKESPMIAARGAEGRSCAPKRACSVSFLQASVAGLRVLGFW